MKRTNVVVIRCIACQSNIGTMYEEEDKARPGFFTNRCVPNPMPTWCDTCRNPLQRVITNNLEGNII